MCVNRDDREEIYVLGLRAIRDITQALNYVNLYKDYDANTNFDEAKLNLFKCIDEFKKYE